MNKATRSHYLFPASIQYYPDTCGSAQKSLTIHKQESCHLTSFLAFFLSLTLLRIVLLLFLVKTAAGSDLEFPGFCVCQQGVTINVRGRTCVSLSVCLKLSSKAPLLQGPVFLLCVCTLGNSGVPIMGWSS